MSRPPLHGAAMAPCSIRFPCTMRAQLQGAARPGEDFAGVVRRMVVAGLAAYANGDVPDEVAAAVAAAVSGTKVSGTKPADPAAPIQEGPMTHSALAASCR
jgi:hypothetical protein